MFVALKIFMVENIKIYDTNSFKMYDLKIDYMPYAILGHRMI